MVRVLLTTVNQADNDTMSEVFFDNMVQPSAASLFVRMFFRRQISLWRFNGSVLISALRTSAVLRVSAVYLVSRFFYRRVAEDRRGTQRMWQTQAPPP